MIERILQKFGYVKYKELTEADLALMYAEIIGDVNEYKIDPKQERIMFRDLAATENLTDYLRATIAKDMQRYFAADNDKQRDIIRGAISRTMYIKSMMSKRPDDKVDTKLKGGRYA